MKIEEAIEELKKEKRNFDQTVDLIITLRNIDLKKPENRITKEIALPHGRGKDAKIGIFSDKIGIKKEEIEKMGKNKKDAKKLAKSYDFFLATADLMPLIGKLLGRFLAPKGKMPQPIPPTFTKEQIDKIVERKKKSILIRVKSSPQIQVPVGKQSMDTKELKENIEHVIKEVVSSLPKGRAQVRDVYLKLTMSKPIKIEW
ncbi:MAG: 50S ribosomal protein L1 [Candidatus Aenigmarchaeota archaeon]|nr:50S ribosomal protein L1 [Candidatus Aenigmarchaeota archaeon]